MVWSARQEGRESLRGQDGCLSFIFGSFRKGLGTGTESAVGLHSSLLLYPTQQSRVLSEVFLNHGFSESLWEVYEFRTLGIPLETSIYCYIHWQKPKIKLLSPLEVSALRIVGPLFSRGGCGVLQHITR